MAVSAEGDAIRVADTGVPLETDTSCTLTDGVALCPAAGLTSVLVKNLSGGNDDFTITAPLRTRVSGGAGNDLLRTRNGVADALVDCGADADVPALIDTVDAPFVKNCPDADDGSVPDTTIDERTAAGYSTRAVPA